MKKIVTVALSNSQLMVQKSADMIIANCYTGNNTGKSLSALQNKIVEYGLQKSYKAGKLIPAEFSIKDFWRDCGITDISGNHEQTVKDALVELPSKRFMKIEHDEKGNKHYTCFPWVITTRFSDSSDKVILEYHYELQEYIQSPQKVIYPLRLLALFTSKYGHKLYDLLKQATGTETAIEVEISMDDFAAYMDCTGYRKKSDIERFVITPAVRDINNYADDLYVGYSIEKKAPKCYSLHFTIQRQEVFSFATGLLDDPNDEKNKQASLKKAEIYTKRQIAYSELYARLDGADATLLDLVVQVMVTVYCAEPNEVIKINRVSMSMGAIQKRYRLLTTEDIMSVIRKTTENKESIKNLMTYLQTMLFNEPQIGSIQTSKTEKQEYQDRQLDADELAAIRRLMAEKLEPMPA